MSSTPWRANLDWLGSNDPELQALVFDVPAPGRLRLERGEVRWHRGLNPTRVEETDAVVEAALEALDPERPVVLVGVGTGALLRTLLDRTEGPVVAWDRDPTFLLPALLETDWTSWLQSGRLRFARGADLITLVGQRILHPVLRAAYTDELAFVGDGRPRALLVDGTLFVADVGEALRDAGWDVFRWDVHELPEAELSRTARLVRPDVVVAINHTPGLAEACEALGVPVVEWEIDPATDAVPSTRARGATVWTWRRSQVEVYRNAGFEAHYLPLATNPRRRAPMELSEVDRERYGVPVAYVGSSMVQRGRTLLDVFTTTFRKAFGEAGLGRELARQLLDLQGSRAHTDGYVLPELLEQVAPGIADRFAEVGCRHRPDALLGEIAAARYRLEVLAGLGTLGLHVWGDEGWRALEAHGVTHRGWAGHYHELTRIYQAAAVNVDVGRLYQLDIVPMRIFDVIACGGFVIAQHSDALVELLEPGREIVTWQTRDELEAKVRHYLEHPDARAAIVQAGRERVLAEHTIAARLRRMLAGLEGARRAA